MADFEALRFPEKFVEEAFKKDFPDNFLSFTQSFTACFIETDVNDDDLRKKIIRNTLIDLTSIAEHHQISLSKLMLTPSHQEVWLWKEDQLRQEALVLLNLLATFVNTDEKTMLEPLFYRVIYILMIKAKWIATELQLCINQDYL